MRAARRGAFGRVLLAGAGVWVLGWTFLAWREIDLLLVLFYRTYGCG